MVWTLRRFCVHFSRQGHARREVSASSAMIWTLDAKWRRRTGMRIVEKKRWLVSGVFLYQVSGVLIDAV